jgi:hypothetical protein
MSPAFAASWDRGKIMAKQPSKPRRAGTERRAKARQVADPPETPAPLSDIDPQPLDVDASSDRSRSDSMSSEPSEEAIRLRAYQRYLARGADPGMAFEDWLEAERELKTGK